MARPVALFVVAAVLLSLTARYAAAQVLYSSLVVEARDSGGGAVPGASVTITQQETGWTRSDVTGSAGTVTFANVPPGTFTVRVTLQKFKESVTKDVRVSEGSAVRVASTLEVGQVTEEVTVAAGAAVLQTDRADVRTELNSTQLENLPVPIGRNYQSLFTLVPGITP